MRKTFIGSLTAAWLVVGWIGARPVPETAAVAESAFILLILSVWISASASSMLPQSVWQAAPRIVRRVLLACVWVVVVTTVIETSFSSNSTSGAVTFVSLVVASVVTPIAVIVAYVWRSTVGSR